MSALDSSEHLYQVLLEHGADVDFAFASLNTTALMTSAFHGNIEAVTLLLKNGANVRALDLQKSTALGYAFGGEKRGRRCTLACVRKITIPKHNLSKHRTLPCAEMITYVLPYLRIP